MIQRFGQLASLVSLSLLLAACGGGGKGGSNGGGPTGVVVNIAGLSSGTVNAVYPDQTLSASGGVAPYSWSLSAGGLPPGLTLSTAGVISGTPQAAGNYSFTVRATDSTAVTGSAVLNITIEQLTVSGFVRYEFPPPNANCNGLNLDAPLTRPIRGATVQLVNAGTGAEIASTVSSDTGAYSFSNVDANTLVQVRVLAELKQAGTPGWDVEVRDNFVMGESDNGVFPPAGLSTRAMYRLDGSSFSTGTANVSRNLTAPLGWVAGSYTEPRAAAPFAILDTVYSMMQFIRASDPGAHFGPLDAFWSVNNVGSIDVDLTAGEIGTSSYYGSIDSLFILGDDMSDTDEFDDHIVGHEWGHYFEDTLSRSDSPGGSHFLGESLEATLAFSEGWGYAIAAMALNDPVYCDTARPGTSGFFVNLNAETSGFGVQGWFNEVSVLTFLYDLWDTSDDGTDNSSVGFTPIYNVMTGPQIFTEGFTTLFAFATELRWSVDVPGQTLVDSQLDRENIVFGDDLDIWASNEDNVGGLPALIAEDVMPLYTDYVAGDPAVNICVNSYLDGLDRHGNNIGEDRYLRITVPFDDEYDVSVVTTTPTPPTADPDDRDQSDPDIFVIRGSTAESVGFGITPTENFEPTFRTAMLVAGEIYAAVIEEWRFDDPGAATTYPQQICFDVSFTSTP